jgi:hypothetical protein
MRDTLLKETRENNEVSAHKVKEVAVELPG